MFRRFGFSIAILILIMGVDGFGQAGQTVLQGVYTDDQAMRGEAGYEDNCAYCHRDNLDGSGSPSLFGDRFLDNWREENLDNLYKYIRKEMPRGEGGSLTDEVYIDIITYILKLNALPAGAAELTPAATENILLIGRDGPKPLPNLAQVLVVGCLSQADNTWMLTRATAPVRNRTPDATNPEELKASSSKPAGAQSFRLSFDQLAGFNAGSFTGRRMQAKGVLVKQPNGDRINLASFQEVSGTCN